MAKRKYSSEEIIHKLREADVLLGQGKSIAEACKQLGVTDQKELETENQRLNATRSSKGKRIA